MVVVGVAVAVAVAVGVAVAVAVAVGVVVAVVVAVAVGVVVGEFIMTTTKLQVGGVEHVISQGSGYVYLNRVKVCADLHAGRLRKALRAAKPVENEWNEDMDAALVGEPALLQMLGTHGVGVLCEMEGELLWKAILTDGRSFEFGLEKPEAFAAIPIPEPPKPEARPVEKGDARNIALGVLHRAQAERRDAVEQEARDSKGDDVEHQKRFFVGSTYPTRRQAIEAEAVAEIRCGHYDRLVCVLRNSEDSDENVGVGLYSPFTGTAHRGDEKRYGPHLQYDQEDDVGHELKVGDRVYNGHGRYGELLATDGCMAWVRYDDNVRGTCLLDNFQKVNPTPQPSPAAMRAAEAILLALSKSNNKMTIARIIDEHMQGERNEITELAQKALPFPRGDHGGPLVQSVFTYEDGTVTRVDHTDMTPLLKAVNKSKEAPA